MGVRHGKGRTGFAGGHDVYVHRIHWLWLCFQRRILENFWSTSITLYEAAWIVLEATVGGTSRVLG